MTQVQKYQEYKIILKKTRKIVYSCNTIKHYQSALKYISLAKSKIIQNYLPSNKSSILNNALPYILKDQITTDFTPLKTLCKAKLRNLKQNEQIR